jgi:hypothetical protein
MGFLIKELSKENLAGVELEDLIRICNEFQYV